MKKSFFLALSLLAAATATAKPHREAFVDSLMASMTIEERVGQLNLASSWGFRSALSVGSEAESRAQIASGQMGALYGFKNVEEMRRLQQIAVSSGKHGIPFLFGMDVIHGVETTFPIPLALSCSWNPKLIEESARVAGGEATALGIDWVFSPMVDICRDARWGRIAEGAGEDPYLGAQMARAYIRGYRAAGLNACVKHFALYGAAEAGRDYNTVSMSRQEALNGFMAPYKAAVEAGAGSVMTSFNDFEEIPATCNPWLVDTLLRKQWGFGGFVVTDANAIKETIAHGMGDLQQCSARALQAGVDMDMNSNGFVGTLLASLGEGKVSEREINRACRRVLLAKYDAGLFADPYRRLGGSGRVFTAETRAFARRAARQSQVLLKNNGVLPLRKDAKILLVGPMADRADDMLGCWNITSHKAEAVTLRQGMQNAAPHNIIYREGSWLVADSLLEKTLRTSLLGFLDPNYKPEAVHQRPLQAMIDEAVAAAADADVIVAAVGESNSMNGEGASRADITIPGPQRQLLRALKATGKPVVLALFTGRPLALDWEDANLDAILCLWALGDQGGAAAADVLYGDANPQGRLTTSWPQAVGQCPLYYNHKSTGRPWPDDAPYQKFTSCYIDVPNGPLYPFGYGLSYTEFKYGDIADSDTTLAADSPLTLTLPVTNTGKRGGVATVQLYIHAVTSSSTRPVKELKAFKQVAIAAGETAKVSFTLTQDDLRHYNHDLRLVCEPGMYEIHIGSNSRDTQKIAIHAL